MAGIELIAIDLDGTLFDPAGAVSDENATALARARAAGIRVTICTGRGLVECQHALDRIEQSDPVVVAGGSMIACPRRKRTLHRFSIDQDVVRHATRSVLSHGHPALVLKDPLEAGYDYLVVQGPARIPIDPVTAWWFESMDVRVRYAATLDEDEHPEHTVRVGACGLSGTLSRMKLELVRCFGDDAMIHHFPAVVAPHHARTTEDGQTLHVLEVFDKNANKWSAIRTLARDWDIPDARIAAIGDEINDLPMIRGAGLGIAMGNAVPAVKEAARHQTAPNTQSGVAHAIDRILSGEWRSTDATCPLQTPTLAPKNDPPTHRP